MEHTFCGTNKEKFRHTSEHNKECKESLGISTERGRHGDGITHTMYRCNYHFDIVARGIWSNNIYCKETLVTDLNQKIVFMKNNAVSYPICIMHASMTRAMKVKELDHENMYELK
jgi:hypothetical protein